MNLKEIFGIPMNNRNLRHPLIDNQLRVPMFEISPDFDSLSEFKCTKRISKREKGAVVSNRFGKQLSAPAFNSHTSQKFQKVF
jgi:hypothetical protein